jgi:putative ABC transport system permease protein
MTALQLVWAYVRARPLQSTLNVLLLALGVATITLAMSVSRQIERSFERDLAGIDLVVGAKGSPLQLILSGVFHVDIPTGNIPLEAAAKLRQHAMVGTSIPLSLGDSFRGFRIVGTEPAYITHYNASFAHGCVWNAAMQAVLGADVARTTGIGVGASFIGIHGLGEGGHEHGESPYTVTGVLSRCNCVLDRLVLVSTESVWQVHEKATAETEEDKKILQQEREITLLLLQFNTPLAMVTLPRLINTQTEMQAASPAFEAARLMRMLGTGVDVLRAFGVMLMLAAAVALLVAMISALNERRHDLAMLRLLGSTPAKLSRLLLLEALLLASAGLLLGLALGHGLTHMLGLYLQADRSLAVSGFDFAWQDLWLVAGALTLAALAAAVPLINAYRLNVSEVLGER